MISKGSFGSGLFVLLIAVSVQRISSAATNEPAYQNDLDAPPAYAHKENPESFTKRSLQRDCESTYSATCLKLDIVSFIEKMSQSQDFSILPGLSVVKEASVNHSETAEIVADLARSFPNDPEKRLDSYLMYKLNSYLDSHALRLRLIEDGGAEKLGEGRKGGGGFGGGGGGGGKKGGYGGLMAAALMMKGTLGALGMGALAMLAGKALMTALMSLMLSAIIGLKSLTSGGHKSTTYEIVTKPVYSHSQSHSSSHEDAHIGGGGGYGHSGYGRSLNLELPKHLQNQQN